MWEYLQINIGLFGLALAALYWLKNAPARLRFYIIISTLLCWLVPWSWVQIPLPDAIVQPIKVFKVYELKDITHLFADDIAQLETAGGLSNLATHSPQVKASAESALSSSGLFSQMVTADVLYYGFILLLSVGLMLIVADIRNYRDMIRRWQAKSQPADHLKQQFNLSNHIEFRRIKASEPGMATGIFRPTVWISEDIQDREVLESILVHELTHIKHHDVFWLWLISAIDKLFWWNPLVRHFCRRARDEIEFSCDETCKAELKNDTYFDSLVQLILNKNNNRKRLLEVANLRSRANLNVLRIEALANTRHLRKIHIVLILAFVFAATWLCLAFTYDQRFRDFFLNQKNVFQVSENDQAIIEYNLEDKIFFDFMQHLYKGDLQTAEPAYHNMLATLVTEPERKRKLGFHVLSAYLGDANKYEQIPALYQQLFPGLPTWDGYSETRILAIAFIKTQQYGAAIETLKKTSARSYPHRLLLAQAYHLNGDYKESLAVIDDTLNSRKMSFYNTHRTSLLRLKGKNAEQLGNDELTAQARAELGVDASFSFADVQANQQRIPYIYFLHRGINDHRTSGFDLAAFPLRQEIPNLEDPKHQKIFRKAERMANAGHFEEAKTALESALVSARASENVSIRDETSIMEYLFIINMRLENEEDLVALSESLVLYPNVSKDILARAYWTLASGPRRYTPEGLAQFDQYTNLLNQPSLSMDHERIERYYSQGNPNEAKPALERVVDFYENSQVVPDIRTLNRIIGVFERLGDKENENKYREVFAQHYSRSMDFSLDVFRHVQPNQSGS